MVGVLALPLNVEGVVLVPVVEDGGVAVEVHRKAVVVAVVVPVAVDVLVVELGVVAVPVEVDTLVLDVDSVVALVVGVIRSVL